jgi:hypothetical protein
MLTITAAIALVIVLSRETSPVLTIAPVRHTSLNGMEEKLIVAVTNHSEFIIRGFLGQGTNFDGTVAFELPPHSDTLVSVYGTKRGP